MNVTINIVKIASTLAHNAMLNEINNILGEDELYEIDEKNDRVYKEQYQNIFDRWYDYFFNLIYNKRDVTYFPITSTCKEDLESIGFNTSKVDDDTMKRLASKLGDDYCEQLYWSSLLIIAEYLKIPFK